MVPGHGFAEPFGALSLGSLWHAILGSSSSSEADPARSSNASGEEKLQTTADFEKRGYSSVTVLPCCSAVDEDPKHLSLTCCDKQNKTCSSSASSKHQHHDDCVDSATFEDPHHQQVHSSREDDRDADFPLKAALLFLSYYCSWSVKLLILNRISSSHRHHRPAVSASKVSGGDERLPAAENDEGSDPQGPSVRGADEYPQILRILSAGQSFCAGGKDPCQELDPTNTYRLLDNKCHFSLPTTDLSVKNCGRSFVACC